MMTLLCIEAYINNILENNYIYKKKKWCIFNKSIKIQNKKLYKNNNNNTKLKMHKLIDNNRINKLEMNYKKIEIWIKRV